MGWFPVLSTTTRLDPPSNLKNKTRVKAVSSVFSCAFQIESCLWGLCDKPKPDSELLAEIAIASAETAQSFGIEPKVAIAFLFLWLIR